MTHYQLIHGFMIGIEIIFHGLKWNINNKKIVVLDTPMC